MYGGVALYWYLSWSIKVSGKTTAAAATSTSNCPGPGTGSSTDSTTRSSGGPNALHTTALMRGNRRQHPHTRTASDAVRDSSLQLGAAGVEDRLGVAGWLLHSLEDEVSGGTERAPVVRRRHRYVGRIAGILLVDDDRHAPEGVIDLVAGDDAVGEPVGDMLRGDPARGAVFHEGDAVDVGNLRAPHALVDPAHDVAEDALHVVVDLGAALVGGPVRVGRDRNRQQVVEAGPCLPDQCVLLLAHVDPVVVGGVQRGRGRRGHPRAARPRA